MTQHDAPDVGEMLEVNVAKPPVELLQFMCEVAGDDVPFLKVRTATVRGALAELDAARAELTRVTALREASQQASELLYWARMRSDGREWEQIREAERVLDAALAQPAEAT